MSVSRCSMIGPLTKSENGVERHSTNGPASDNKRSQQRSRLECMQASRLRLFTVFTFIEIKRDISQGTRFEEGRDEYGQDPPTLQHDNVTAKALHMNSVLSDLQ